MSIPVLKILQDYAAVEDPSSIPPSVRLRHTPQTITIFDKFPKASYHFLIIPRIDDDTGLTKQRLMDLKSLLKGDKATARQLLETLEVEAENVTEMIKDEMRKGHGLGEHSDGWEIFVGFHAIPSMQHVHLHVISSDYVSTSLKTKKHYNSFHPSLGFFLGLKDVMSWFDLPDASFTKLASFPSSQYEHLLKEQLSCWKCKTTFSNMPKLKDHLQDHMNKEVRRLQGKRKREAKSADDDAKKEDGDEDEPAPKKMNNE